MSDRQSLKDSLAVHYSGWSESKRVADQATNRGFLLQREAQNMRIELSGLRIFDPGDDADALENEK